MYHSHQQYADFFTFSADEWIIKQLLPKFESNPINCNRRFMFIGPGPSPTVEPILDYFDELVLVEPNPLFIAKWKSYEWYQTCLKLNKKITIIQNVIEDLALSPSNKYINDLQKHSMDVIIATHVAYYFPNEYMSDIIAYLLSLLKQATGILSIGVDDDELDLCAQIMKQVNNKYECSQIIENVYNKTRLKYSKLIEFVTFKMEKLDDVRKTLGFFVKEGAFNSNWFNGKLSNDTETKLNDIIEYVIEHKITKKDGCYLVPNYTVHFVTEMKENILKCRL
eukprot:421268_1